MEFYGVPLSSSNSMASTRQMRKSPRTASPFNNTVTETSKENPQTHIRKEILYPKQFTWTEPPTRPPAPSFQDHRGLERQGVLEHMAPLGSLPNAKVKLRVKQYEPGKRFVQTKLSDNGIGGGGRGVAAVAKDKRREVPKRTNSDTNGIIHGEQPNGIIQSTEKDEVDADFAPSPKRQRLVTPQQRVQSAAPPTLPTVKSPYTGNRVTHDALKPIVDSAVERSVDIGRPSLGLAVRRLYEQSFGDPNLATLLTAILSQRPTPIQSEEFQKFINRSRKEMKAEKKSRRSSVAGNSLNNNTPEAINRILAINNGGNHDRHNSPLAQQSIIKHTPLQSPISRSTSPTTFMNPDYLSPSTMTTRKRPAGPSEAPVNKRAKREISVASQESALSEIDSDGLKDLEEASKKELLPGSNGISTPTEDITLESKPPVHKFATRQNKIPLKKTAEPVELPSEADKAAQEETIAMRRKLRRDFKDYHIEESHIRPSTYQTPPPSLQPSLNDIPIIAEPSRHQGELDTAQSTTSSQPEEPFLPIPPTLRHSSRAATPSRLARPLKGSIKTARVKISPRKKDSNVTAGIARGGRGTDRLVGRDQAADDSEEVDNVDFCSACGGEGKLLCCDGCPQSFHFSCLDPPISCDNPPSGEWFCPRCADKRHPELKDGLLPGIFNALLRGLIPRNPVAFNLPEQLRDYFEGVKTGGDGEFEEVATVKSKSRGIFDGESMDKAPDVHRVQTIKERPVLCHACGRSSMGQRQIINCDYCDLKWHLDCLDPPLANPPVQKLGDSKTKASLWKCPNHVDPEFITQYAYENLLMANGAHSCRRIPMRKPKRPRIVSSALRRGFKNNGLVEIELESSDDEVEVEDEGVIYRIREQGVRLDFLERARQARSEIASKGNSHTRVAHPQVNGVKQNITMTQIPPPLPSTLLAADLDAAQGLLQLGSAFAPLVLTESAFTRPVAGRRNSL
ncbi:hypothetical protein MMC25_001065 [Agyrium rufum]|nr:hypothetical protein [Agyrium rufum]